MNANLPKRPSPEALLKHARKEARGQLKIFLGAAPGVGKTFEMLREGAELLNHGRDVVIGIVESHGRADTEALVAALPVLPRKVIDHGAHQLTELDIDAILMRKPDIVLVDEFAHTNAPGSRHPKRWQDVEELRDAGIDVLTTLNIQHVESLNDVVAGFTRVRVRETIPDALLDDADIEVVDLPPDELIERLKAGKVYIPHEATRALGHFFSKSNLSALRELALRRAAQAVDRQMLEHVEVAGDAGNWAVGERLVVAIGDQPGGEALVRAAKRLADTMHARWTAVTVETPRNARISAMGRARIAAALKLASELGAVIATIPAPNVAEGLRAHMLEAKVTGIVIGRSPRNWWFRLRHGSVIDGLVRGLEGVAVYVMPQAAQVDASDDEAAAPSGGNWTSHITGLSLVALTTVAALGLVPFTGPNPIDLLYLIPVIATATLFGLRPALTASLAAALAYNFFFLEPLYTFTISDPQNAITFVILAAVGVAASHLTGRLKREATIGARTAAENAAIAAFGQRLAAVGDEAGTSKAVCEEIGALLDVSTCLVSRRKQKMMVLAFNPDEPSLSPVDDAAAEWAFDRGETSGRDTRTLNASDWQFHPLVTALGVLGVLGICRTAGGDPVPPEKQVLFATLLGQAALAHERVILESKAREVGALQQRDDLRATLLASISHDLKTPLTAVIAAADALALDHGASTTSDLLKAQAHRLGRVFDDLIEMTRIEAGALVVRHDILDLTDTVAAAAQDLKAELAAHRLLLDVPSTLPLVEADPRMLNHILVNLIGNAAKYAPAGTTITLEGRRDPGGLSFSVLDEGPGLPPGDASTLFDRFVRVEGNDRSGGTGLGLAIVKGFADAMGLTISADNRDGALGSRFTLFWPSALLRKAQQEGVQL